MGNHGPAIFCGAEERLNIAQSEAIELFVRIGGPTMEAQQAGETMRDILVEDEGDSSHASGERRGVRFEQRIDSATVLAVVQQCRPHRLARCHSRPQLARSCHR